MRKNNRFIYTINNNIIGNNMIKIVKCNRCQHEWPTKQKEPKWCPACKSPYWNRKRVRK